MAATVDKVEILRGLQVYHQPGDTFEIRILDTRYKVISGYFKDFNNAADAAISYNGEYAIYVTINPTTPRLIARANNKLKKYAKNTTSDADIARLNWLPCDCDPPRPAGISSTDEEHDISIEKCKEIKQWLIDDRGWPEKAFVIVNSANGGYLLARIELENIKENSGLVAKCLETLDYLYTDEKFHVDTTSGNPARILRVPGTLNAKGDEVDDLAMHHRVARVLDAPDSFEAVPRVKLVALAAMLPEPERVAQATYNAGGDVFDPVAYCQAHNLQVHHTKPYKGGTLVVLDECIFDSSHKLSAAIIGWPSGGHDYTCRHHSCQNKSWADAKAVIEPMHSQETEAEKHLREFAEYNPIMLRADAGKFEAEHPGCKIFNCDDDPKLGEISEEELNAYSLPEGPKFECKLPKDHFLQRFTAYGYDVSDAYPEYWFAGGIFALAVVADKKIKSALRQMTVYPNLYVAILGKSSLARKSTAVDKAEALLDEVWPFLMDAKVPTEFSPEAFIEHMDAHNHAPWIRDEAAGVLSLMKKDYMRGFKDSLLSLFDCKPFHRKLRTSQRKGAKTDFKVEDPYLNLLWATTGASFGANTDLNDTLSGFLARFLFFFPQGKKDRWLPLEKGSALNSDMEYVVRSQLLGIANKMCDIKTCVDMDISSEANAFWATWQKEREDQCQATNDDFNAQIFSRMGPVVVKLSMLFELGSPDFDPVRPIRLTFLQEACRLVDSYLMPISRAVYDLVGSNVEKNIIDRIVAYLKNHNGKATAKEVMRDVKIKKKDFEEYLDTMLEAEIIRTETVHHEGKAGRPSLYVFLLGQNNFVEIVDKEDKVDLVDIVEEIHSDFISKGASTKSTQSTKSIKSNEIDDIQTKPADDESIKALQERADEETRN